MGRNIFLFFTAIFLGQCVDGIAQTPLEILVSNRGGNAIARFDEGGNYLGDFISPGSGGLSDPQDIIFHPDGSVLVTGISNTAIKRYDGVTGAFLGDFSSGYALSLPSKMTIGHDDLIYVTQWGPTQNKVVRFDLDGYFVDEFTSIGAPKGLGHVWDAGKNFYISLFGATGGAGTVHKFDSAGNDAGTFINSTILDGPTDIWFDTNGDMLVEDWNAGKILRYNSLGQYLSVFTTGMTNPEGLAFLPNGDLLVGDWGEDAVHHIAADGTLLGYFCNEHLIDPNCVKVRPMTNAAVTTIDQKVKFVWPNTGTQFTISLPVDMVHTAKISVYNMEGRVVERIDPVVTTKWDASHYPNGMYIIEVRDMNHVFHERVMVN